MRGADGRPVLPTHMAIWTAPDGTVKATALKALGPSIEASEALIEAARAQGLIVLDTREATGAGRIAPTA